MNEVSDALIQDNKDTRVVFVIAKQGTKMGRRGNDVCSKHSFTQNNQTVSETNKAFLLPFTSHKTERSPQKQAGHCKYSSLRTALMDSLMTHFNPPLIVIAFYMTSNSTGTLEIQANPLENRDLPN